MSVFSLHLRETEQESGLPRQTMSVLFVQTKSFPAIVKQLL